VTLIVVYKLFENVEAIVFKCQLCKAAKRHCFNWLDNFDQSKEPMDRFETELFKPHQVLSNLNQKALLTQRTEQINMQVLKATLSVLMCYYWRKL
jgi:hypothetical protein